MVSCMILLVCSIRFVIYMNSADGVKLNVEYFLFRFVSFIYFRKKYVTENKNRTKMAPYGTVRSRLNIFF